MTLSHGIVRLAPGLLVCASFAAACTSDRIADPREGVAEVGVIVRGMSGTRIVAIQVSGPGIDSTLLFNISIETTGLGSGSIEIPAGSERHIVANAYDSVGVNTHRGDTTVNLVVGANPPLHLVLQPLVGSVPITITFGGSGIVVEPGDTTIGVGDTARYTGGGLDSLGNSIPPTAVVWSSTMPLVASVSASGLVQGRSAGSAWVMATYEGASAGRHITVQ